MAYKFAKGKIYSVARRNLKIKDSSQYENQVFFRGRKETS